ncbi:MAG: glycosyltransferase family 39 protein [Planctomycetota bacterium]|jgi:4-amino-4-deoxy-L-arabinose transferase-like glycosyltransferase
MKTETLNSISRFFKHALLTVAILYLAVYLILVFLRIQFPFELEWMEGGSVHQIERILEGKKLYVSPSLEFVPYIYPPLYFYVSAFVAKITGPGFTPLRLVSFLSSLGCFLIIFLFVKRETKNNFFGIIAACLFAATFRIGGAFFDIARVDSLFLLFLLIALYLIKFKDSLTSYILAAVFISLSSLTKQTALLMAVPVALYCILSNWRRSILFIAVVCIIVAASTFILDYTHQGWYSYYVFELPSQHSVNPQMYTHFWVADIARPLLIAFVLSIFYIFSQFSTADKKHYLFYSIITIGVLALSWMARLNRGGFPNALIPTYAVISILFALEAHAFSQSFQAVPERTQKLMQIRVYFLCIAQFLVLLYNPVQQVPSPQDLQAGTELVNTIKQIKGDVFIPSHSYLPVLAGKPRYVDESAAAELVGIFGGEHKKEGKKLLYEINQAIINKKFSAIILDDPWLRKQVEQYYTAQRPAFYDNNVFWPVTGRRIRPQAIYVPKE